MSRQRVALAAAFTSGVEPVHNTQLDRLVPLYDPYGQAAGAVTWARQYLPAGHTIGADEPYGQ